MHQFRTKGDVLNALMEHQQDYYQRFQRDYLAARDPGAGSRRCPRRSRRCAK